MLRLSGSPTQLRKKVTHRRVRSKRFGGALAWFNSSTLLPSLEMMISLIRLLSEGLDINLFGIMIDSDLFRRKLKYRGLSITLRTLSQATCAKFLPRTISKPSSFSGNMKWTLFSDSARSLRCFRYEAWIRKN